MLNASCEIALMTALVSVLIAVGLLQQMSGEPASESL
jgi:hypothetical protein